MEISRSANVTSNNPIQRIQWLCLPSLFPTTNTSARRSHLQLLPMRLQQLVPPLDAHFVEKLSEIDIKTDVDLLLASSPDSIFARLPPGHSITLRAFRDSLAHARELCAAPMSYGDELLSRDAKRRADAALEGDAGIRVGVDALDALVGGGFAPPRVVEISGESGSGKTVSLSERTSM